MSVRTIAFGLAERSLKLIPRVPSTFVPSLVMPIFLVLSFSGAFAGLTNLPRFPADEMIDWVLPMAMLQGCAFAGVTTGVNVARDFESGFYDRLIMSPAARSALVAGPLLAAMVRCLIPMTILAVIGTAMGADMPGGPMGALCIFVAGQFVSLIAAGWALGMAYRTKTVNAAPLIQMAMFMTFFLSTAQMPLELLTGWVHDAARFNPMTNILAFARQGLLGDVTWDGSWAGLVTGAAGALFFALFAYRGVTRVVR